MLRRAIPFLLLVACFLVSPARADDAPFVPEGLPHQGRLLDGQDQPVTGQVGMTFNLYRQAAGGTAVWTETRTVSVDDGFYSLVLGDPAVAGTTPITTDLLSGPTFLGVTVGGNELSPRLQFGTVPYAHRADLANRMQGGTITGATITGSSVDATDIKVNGQTVVDENGDFPTLAQQLQADGVVAHDAANLGGRPASSYVTTDTLTNGYATSSELSAQEYDNRVRNGSFEVDPTHGVPSFWQAVGGGAGGISQIADARVGESALDVSDNDNAATVAVEQVVIPAAEIAQHVGETFTVSAFAKKKAGASSTHGRLCLAPADDPSTWDCTDLGTGAGWALSSKSHVVTAQATELAVVLDSGAEPGDANDYEFDGVMMTRGSLVVPFAPSPAEAFEDGSIAASKISAGPGSGLDADTLDGIDSTGFVRGNFIAGNASGNVPVSNGTVNTNLNADKLDGFDASDFMQLASAQTISGAKTFSAPLTVDSDIVGVNDTISFAPNPGGGGGDAATLSYRPYVAGSESTELLVDVENDPTDRIRLHATGGVVVDPPTGIGRALTVQGDQAITGNTILSGLLVVGGNASVTGTTTLTGDATLKGNATIGGKATVGGDATVAGNLQVAGDFKSSCRSGWASVNGGHVCVSALQAPTDFYTAEDRCRAVPGNGLNAHVCSYAETQAACANGAISSTGAPFGWYSDLGNADDAFQTWNENNCASNNTGGAAASGAQAPYRCCY